MEIYASLFTRKIFYVVLILLFSIIGFVFWETTQTKDRVPVNLRSKPLPYYFKNGTIYPQASKISKVTGRRDAKLLPFEDPDSDRIENQSMFVPPNYDEIRKSNKTKSIFLYTPFGSKMPGIDKKYTFFADKNCPVSTCTISINETDAEKADFVMVDSFFKYVPIKLKRTLNQIYGLYSVLSPAHYPIRFANASIYNWTMTYRHDSTIPIPYFKWVYYDPKVTEIPQTINYAANKTKKVTWLISDCLRQNDRLTIGHMLQKYIQVDIYGKCGPLKCAEDMNECLDMIGKEYKFYLAFENTNCADYISEKLFRNALAHNIVPIVLGARRKEYERQAPRGSYISVEDFSSVKALAEYLHKVDKDDDLYNSYFKWKGTGEILDHKANFWCRLCAMLHDDYNTSPRWYNDINKWWFDENTCRHGFWRDLDKK